MTSARYPLLQAYVTQDRIRELMEIAYRAEARCDLVMARDAMLKAREAINRTTGNKNVARAVASEAKRLRQAAMNQETERVLARV